MNSQRLLCSKKWCGILILKIFGIQTFFCIIVLKITTKNGKGNLLLRILPLFSKKKLYLLNLGHSTGQ